MNKQIAIIILCCCCLVACQPPAVTHYERQDVPEKLSEWQLLHIDNGRLKPNEGVVSYELAMPLFSDYAHKYRTLYLPPGTSLTLKDNGDFNFPVGAIITKTFYYPKDEQGVIRASYQTDNFAEGLPVDQNQLVETRLLVHQQDGWQALPYVWDNSQSDASLEWAGDVKSMVLKGDEGEFAFTYIVPDANQCQGCHTPNHTSKAIAPIGVKARHLNNPLSFNDQNQLAWLAEQGVIKSLVRPTEWRHNPGWQSDADVEALARGYLDINCGHCHNPQGPADTSGLWLDRDTSDKRRLGLCKPPVAAGRGAGHARFGIMPGESDNSILSYRMASVDPGEMMPELGRATVDEKGLALINQWIDNMPETCQ